MRGQGDGGAMISTVEASPLQVSPRPYQTRRCSKTRMSLALRTGSSHLLKQLPGRFVRIAKRSHLISAQRWGW